MLPIGREEFIDELRALPADRRAAFLAALYGYRGRQVDRTGSLVYVDGPDGSTIFVPGGNKQNERDTEEGENTERIQPADVDAVLAFEKGSTGENTEMAGAGRTDSSSLVPPGVERIEAADLHQAILYAIDRTDCEKLVNEFFSRSLSSFEDTDAPPKGTVWGDDGESARPSTEDTFDARVDTAADPESDAKQTASQPERGPVKHEPTGSSIPGLGTRGRDAPHPATDGRRAGPRPAEIVVVSLAAIVVLAAVLGGMVLSEPSVGDDSIEFGGDAAVTTTPATPIDDIQTATDIETTATVEPDRPLEGTVRDYNVSLPPGISVESDEPRPPGIAASGKIDERQLTDAHRRALANRSFQLTFTYREFVDAPPGSAVERRRVVGERREVVRVANDSHYRIDIYERWYLSITETFRTDPMSLADREAYADGSTVTYRTEADEQEQSKPLMLSDDVDERNRSTDTLYDEAVAHYIRRFLSVEEPTLAGRTTIDNRTVYRIRIEDDPWPEMTNTSGIMLVAQDGLVREIRHEYGFSNHDGVRARVTIHVSNVGSTTAPAPRWYAERSTIEPSKPAPDRGPNTEGRRR